MKKAFICLFLINITLSCSKEQGTFDVNSTNLEIIKSIDVDLLEYKKMVDSILPSKKFYVKLCSEVTTGVSDGEIFNNFGPIENYDSGIKIKHSDRDSIINNIASSLALNINLAGCKEKKVTDIECEYRNQWYKNLSSVDGMYTLTANDTYGVIWEDYKNGRLNKDEFEYMCILFHFLFSVSILQP